MTTRNPSICFVAPALWPVLSGDRHLRTVGGAEVQQTILAHALVEAGHKVSAITMDYGQPDGVEVNGIRVYKIHTPNGGMPVLRFIHPRLTSIWRAMRRAESNIYYQRSAGMLTGVVAHFCVRYNRQMIYAAAHDDDFDAALPLIRYERDRWLYRYGLRHAHRIIVQNSVQQAECLRVYQRSSTPIPSCYPSTSTRANPRGHILWVATLRAWKRPGLFIELARRLPDQRFRMVGGPDDADPTLYETIRTDAAAIDNVEFAGFIHYAAIEREFDDAWLFINTSTREGFPNTFLQAWARGIPTLSFLDLESTYAHFDGNITANTLEEMIKSIRVLADNPREYNRCSIQSLEHFNRHHSVDAVTGAYTALLKLMRAEANHSP